MGANEVFALALHCIGLVDGAVCCTVLSILCYGKEYEQAVCFVCERGNYWV